MLGLEITLIISTKKHYQFGSVLILLNTLYVLIVRLEHSSMSDSENILYTLTVSASFLHHKSTYF